MNIPVTVKIPDLWGEQTFEKSEWGSINYLVGPNGSGKTRFSDQLKTSLATAGLKPRYLSAERLAGLEKHQSIMGHGGALDRGFNVGIYKQYKEYGNNQGLSADAFIILKEKINVRIKIEAFLSSIFKRRIRFAEEGGFLKPKIQKILGGTEYGMKDAECHGLKELITLLAFIYDDEFNAIIVDEPELHLHPQFQTFFLAEIRKCSGNPKLDPDKKVFFIITHSPYLLDFRTLEDLRNCLIFHQNSAPTCIAELEAQDEYCLSRLIPRLNTHHKQFFFASRPIFVEGYTDQQLFSLIQDSREKLLGATGACFIDVNGKDEQDLFFRLCKNLRIDAQFISDLDLLTRGSFRNSISDDQRCIKYVSENGIGPNFMEAIRELNNRLDALIRLIVATSEDSLEALRNDLRVSQETESKRYRALVETMHNRNVLVSALTNNVGDVDYVASRVKILVGAANEAGVYILLKGALENHLPSYTGPIHSIPDRSKSSVFESERDFVMNNQNKKALEDRYCDLIPILDKACGACDVDLKQHLEYAIRVFVGSVQVAFEKGEIADSETVKQHANIDWKTYERILEMLDLNISGRSFTCRMKLKSIVDPAECEFEFTDTTVHSKFQLS